MSLDLRYSFSSRISSDVFVDKSDCSYYSDLVCYIYLSLNVWIYCSRLSFSWIESSMETLSYYFSRLFYSKSLCRLCLFRSMSYFFESLYVIVCLTLFNLNFRLLHYCSKELHFLFSTCI